MREFFELIGSLVRPFFGMVASIATGQFGWSPILGLLNQLFVQSMCLGMLCAVTGGSFVAGILLLMALHLVGTFLIGAGYVGASFGPGAASEDGSRTFARTALIYAACAALLPTIAILASFSHGGFIATVFAIVFSAAFGAAVDVLTVVVPLDRLAAQNRARLDDNNTGRNEDDAVTVGRD